MLRVSQISCIAFALLVWAGCDWNNSSSPTGPAKQDSVHVEPALLHSGLSDSLWPLAAASESVYVRGAKPGEWNIVLESGPAGTTFADGRIRYLLPEGLSGPQAVHMLAAKDSAILRADWTVTVRPKADQPPVITAPACPEWAAVGQTLRLVFKASDPENQPLHFESVLLPAGAALADSIVTWTPTPEEAPYGQYFTIKVTDPVGANAVASCSIAARKTDPVPYGPDLHAGRSWWIRGYSRDSSALQPRNDSIAVRRRLTLLTVDSAQRTFSVRVEDTLSGSESRHRDTLYHCSLKVGYALDCGTDPIPYFVPFEWRGDAPISQDTSIALANRALKGRWDIFPSTCTNGGGSKYGCGGSQDIFVPGWGMLWQHSESASPFSGSTYRSEFTVWAVSDP